MQKNVLEFLKGLDKQAETIEKIVAGSTLNPHQTEALIGVHHYLLDGHTWYTNLKAQEATSK